MDRKGIKQLELAKVVGVSTAAVNKWVKGNTKN
ncbi:helix-turn-helix transcriptional regulator [Pelistega sp. NLN82]|uniref:Helix-turn-helix transcriptional regulator n=1 Tax=Pelistega ratti TaxID=2652177 RepID=A0A6L9Y7N2_9BURK|nr:helix-turn-helix transcriptional regulator [Pelistega ratti]NEN76520.1 helix-turn-helix transcriptional regulator [Pelistega ratti]